MNTTPHEQPQNGTPHDEPMPQQADTPRTSVESHANVTVEGEVVEASSEAAAETSVTADAAAELAELRQRLEAAEQEAAEAKNQWMRAVADFRNYKRRSEAERAELTRTAGANVLLKLLPVVDDFERAADNIPPDIAETPWWSGTHLINQKLQSMLESEGVTAIAALGEPFDPNLHDAVVYEEAEGQDGLVTAELQRGYKLHERVLRPTMVKVGKG